MTDFNRYVARDGKLFEMVRRDPNELREISLDRTANGQLHLAVRLATELNAAHATGYQSCREDLKRVIGL